MTDMERLARVLAIGRWGSSDMALQGADGRTVPAWEAEVPDVLNLLRALRKPSEGMVEDGAPYAACYDGRFHTADKVAATTFTAMIDHIIAQGKGKG